MGDETMVRMVSYWGGPLDGETTYTLAYYVAPDVTRCEWWPGVDGAYWLMHTASGQPFMRWTESREAA